MNQQTTIDIETETALARREPQALEPVQDGKVIQMTPAQAKVEAVAALTMKAYERASMLQLTDEEIAALSEDFPDEAFLSGAAGKENLLYCQHSYLRDRLNKVFRPGQWSIIPRNRWAEEFTTQSNKPASRVYVEAMLVIRGCFVAEAVGEMEYYPNNASQNYGDAVEGAKTAALRRCCKELGIGLQAWKKEWCDAWWQRKRGHKPATTPPQSTGNAPTRHPEPEKAKSTTALKEATDKTREWMISELASIEQDALRYFIESGIILPTESLNEIPLHHVPTSRGGLARLQAAIDTFKTTGKVEKLTTPAQELPLDDESWRGVIVPIPHRGQKRDEYLKNPDTIGSLFDARHDDDESRSRLFGFFHNFTPKPWTGKDGKERPPSDSDKKFRVALDAFGDWFEKNHPEERTND